MSAKKQEISINPGAGNGSVFNPPFFPSIETEGALKPTPFYFYRIGVGFYYTPKKVIFGYHASLSYDTWRTDQTGLDYIRVPLGIAFHLGKKLHGIVGTGPVLSYIFSNSGNNYTKLDYLKVN